MPGNLHESDETVGSLTVWSLSVYFLQRPWAGRRSAGGRERKQAAEQEGPHPCLGRFACSL